MRAHQHGATAKRTAGGVDRKNLADVRGSQGSPSNYKNPLIRGASRTSRLGRPRSGLSTKRHALVARRGRRW